MPSSRPAARRACTRACPCARSSDGHGTPQVPRHRDGFARQLRDGQVLCERGARDRPVQGGRQGLPELQRRRAGVALAAQLVAAAQHPAHVARRPVRRRHRDPAPLARPGAARRDRRLCLGQRVRGAALRAALLPRHHLRRRRAGLRRHAQPERAPVALARRERPLARAGSQARRAAQGGARRVPRRELLVPHAAVPRAAAGVVRDAPGHDHRGRGPDGRGQVDHRAAALPLLRRRRRRHPRRRAGRGPSHAALAPRRRRGGPAGHRPRASRRGRTASLRRTRTHRSACVLCACCRCRCCRCRCRRC